MRKPIHILGIGRNTVTVIDLVEDCGYRIAGLWHFDGSRTAEEYFGYRINGSFEDLLNRPSLDGQLFALSMGDLAIRRRLFIEIERKGGEVPTLIHPSCRVSRHSTLGRGIQMHPGSIVQGDSSVGDNTVITVNSVIAHSSSVGRDCLISGNVMVGAYAHVGDSTHIGQGATIVSGKVASIGDHCVLGAGSTLLCDMPIRSVFAGCPARFIKNND